MVAPVGAVLCGGASRRMGRDKALVPIEGVALARRVADALVAGGCARVLAVGGDATRLAALGLEPVPDRWPGEGPLGGLATALGAADEGDVLVLAPCDLLHPSPAAVATLLGALAAPEVDAVSVRVGDRVQWLPSAWRVTARRAAQVADLVDGGDRRLDAVAALVGAGVRTVDLAPHEVADADTPADLP
ncbi:MAG TPA: molybdenum cofactor guanylyltransferase [Iamia sp.]|nr:molybdenum cofactor guanylyltransferase [Iamia sp.]